MHIGTQKGDRIQTNFASRISDSLSCGIPYGKVVSGQCRVAVGPPLSLARGSVTLIFAVLFEFQYCDKSSSQDDISALFILEFNALCLSELRICVQYIRGRRGGGEGGRGEGSLMAPAVIHGRIMRGRRVNFLELLISRWLGKSGCLSVCLSVCLSEFGSSYNCVRIVLYNCVHAVQLRNASYHTSSTLS